MPASAKASKAIKRHNSKRLYKLACTEQAYVLYIRTQQEKVHSYIASLTSKRARKMKELSGKDEVRVSTCGKRRKLIRLVKVIIKSADRLQQPYVCTPYVSTQLAIAICTEQLRTHVCTQLATATIATAKERIKRLTSKYEAKQMKLASYHMRIKRLTSKQLAIANQPVNACKLSLIHI